MRELLDRPAPSAESEAAAKARPAKAAVADDGASVASTKKSVSFQAPKGRLTELVRGGDEPRDAPWDCESVLSTYSNVYNHPTMVREPGRRRRPGGDAGDGAIVGEGAQVRIGPNGMPLNVIGKGKGGRPERRADAPGGRAVGGGDGDGDGDEDDDGSEDDDAPTTLASVNKGVARPTKETVEEKRARKKAIKEERRDRREEKKSTKAAFKNEQLRQDREHQQARLQTGAVPLM